MNETGQRWLRKCCELSQDRGTFIAKMREFTEELYLAESVEGGFAKGQDVYRYMDDLWRAHATGSIAEDD